MELLGKRIAEDHISSTADTKGAAATVVKPPGCYQMSSDS